MVITDQFSKIRRKYLRKTWTQDYISQCLVYCSLYYTGFHSNSRDWSVTLKSGIKKLSFFGFLFFLLSPGPVYIGFDVYRVRRLVLSKFGNKLQIFQCFDFLSHDILLYLDQGQLAVDLLSLSNRVHTPIVASTQAGHARPACWSQSPAFSAFCWKVDRTFEQNATLFRE